MTSVQHHSIIIQCLHGHVGHSSCLSYSTSLCCVLVLTSRSVILEVLVATIQQHVNDMEGCRSNVQVGYAFDGILVIHLAVDETV